MASLGSGAEPRVGYAGAGYAEEDLNTFFSRELFGLFESPITMQVRHLEFSDIRELHPLREQHLRHYVRYLASYESVRMKKPQSVELVATLERTLGNRLIWT